MALPFQRTTKTGPLDAIDMTALRAKVMDVVEEAIDRAEAALHDAPRPSEVAGLAKQRAERVRRSQTVEAATAALGASMPFIVEAVKRRVTTRNARRAAKFTPWALRAHPVLFGAAVAGGALIGVAYLRHQRQEQRELTSSSGGDAGLRSAHERFEARADGFDLEDEVARMEAEGGEPAGASEAPVVVEGTTTSNGAAR